MPRIKVQVSDETGRKFRERAMRRFGFGKGALSLAAERAFAEWARREETLDHVLVEIGDPVEAIEGLLAHVKMDSVKLQHEAAKLRAARALHHGARRR